LIKVIRATPLAWQSCANKIKEIFGIISFPKGNTEFITSSASVHRDLSIRNPELFKVLNSN